MSKARFKSSVFGYYSLKYGLGLLGFIFVLSLVNNVLMTSSIAEVESGKWRLFIGGFIAILLQLFLFKRVSSIRIDEERVYVKSSDGHRIYPIDQIEKIERIKFIQPPIYRIKINGAPRYYLFLSGFAYLNVNGIIKEFGK